MTTASPDALPDDLGALHAMIFAERAEKQLLIAERDQLNAAVDKLYHIIAVLRRARFGRKSERLSEDQLNLALEELETASQGDSKNRTRGVLTGPANQIL
jgi:hypothetical protein